MKKLLTLLLLAGLCAGVFALGSLRKGEDGKAVLHVAEDVALTVNVAEPKEEEIIRLVQAPGDVEAVKEVEISSEIVSKIIDMPIEEGDEVEAGDRLCQLDDKNLMAEVESGTAGVARLRALVAGAEADLEKAERDVSRQTDLSESRATSDYELRDHVTIRKKARSVLDMRRQELIQADAYLKRAKEDLKKTTIVAPIDGVVSRLNAKEGEVVITGTMNNPGTVIMSVSDLSRMQVRARIDEVDVPLVRPGQHGRVYLQSSPDVPIPARVVRVAPSGARATGRDVVTFEALLEILSKDAGIKPGMTSNVEIEVDTRQGAITVPVEAVVHRMRKDLPDSIIEAFDKLQAGLDISNRVRFGQYIKVLYVMADEKAQVRLVETGIADTRRVEISSGVALGERVIVGPYRSLDQLEDGQKVALAEDDEKDDEDSDKADKEELAGKDQKKGEDDHAKDKQTVATSATP